MEPDEWRVTPILKASRESRGHAADALPALVDRLVERTEAQAKEIRAKADKVNSLVSEIRKVKP